MAVSVVSPAVPRRVDPQAYICAQILPARIAAVNPLDAGHLKVSSPFDDPSKGLAA
jgi:hypothetical protein